MNLSHAIFKRTLLLAILLPAISWGQEKPNVVLMVMDNLGWGEIGAYGGGSGLAAQCDSPGVIIL